MALSPESVAFKRNYSLLSNRLYDPSGLVPNLYSEDVITRRTREDFFDSQSPVNKRHILLNELERSIEQDSENFDKFLTALKTDPATVKLAQQLDEDRVATKSLQGRPRSHSAPPSHSAPLIPLLPSAAIHANDTNTNPSCVLCPGTAAVTLNPCKCKCCDGCIKQPPAGTCPYCNTKILNRRIATTKSFLYDPRVSPETEAFKMFYSDLLKNVNDLPTLEDQLSSNGILQKDPDSSRVLPLKRKINLLDKIGSAIATNPQNLEKTLKVLEAHDLVPKTIIARMRSFRGRFDNQHIYSFHSHKYHGKVNPWSVPGLPECCIICSHNNDGGETSDIHTSSCCVMCPNAVFFTACPCQCDYCKECIKEVKQGLGCPYCGSTVEAVASISQYSSNTSENVFTKEDTLSSTTGLSRPSSAVESNGFQVPSQLQSCSHPIFSPGKVSETAKPTLLSDPPVSKLATGTLNSLQIMSVTCRTPQIQSAVPRLASQYKPMSPAQDGLSSGEIIGIRYIICQDLFYTSVEEKAITELNPSTTVSDIYDVIMKEEGISSDLTLEIYSHEGYPLHPNEFTSQCTLKQWGICNQDLFYIFVRKVHQPVFSITTTSPLISPPADPSDIETDELVVESIPSGRFTIKCSLNNKVAGSLYQKVSSVTGVPIPNMVLYSRRGYVALEKETALAKLRGCNKLTLVLTSLHDNSQLQLGPLGTEYGAKTYEPCVVQSDRGVSKFFSILKFICSKQQEHVDISKLLTYLRMLTHCPPLVYALKVLHEESYLSLPCWVALVEGCFQLFKCLLENCCSVRANQVFEFSDYLWALLISSSKVTVSSDSEECEKINLECPISQLKIVEPVTIPGCLETFDKTSVMEMIKAKTPILDCSKYLLTEEDIKTDEIAARMLMYNPWRHEKHGYVWKDTTPVPYEKQWIPKVEMACNWDKLSSNLPLLRIASPDGLCCGDESLTYIENGQVVYFMGFCKTTECYRKVFNPVKCLFEYYDHYQMKYFAVSRYAVSHGLTNFLKQELYQELHQRGIYARIFASQLNVLPAGQEEIVQWDPEEAIVVLLDGSSSMSSSIFQETDSLSRVQAAKDMFIAFANRSLAYGFHHSLGLIVFNTHFTVIQPLMRICECFKESLSEVEANGSTAIYDAIVEAVGQLKEYTRRNHRCKRRILCLSDGEDNSSTALPHAVVSLLQRERVAMDTVLIIKSPTNRDLKAISHASGGTCFVPSSYCEAMKLFEMETILSIRGRAVPHKLPAVSAKKDLDAFRNLSAHPYDNGDLPSIFRDKFKHTQTMPIDRFMITESMVSASNCSTRRILRELMDLKRHPHPAIEIFPSDSLLVWKILLKGPEGTPYENGAFLLILKFPQSYPNKPPEARFITPVYHCNINSSGRICHEVLTTGYTPSISVREILSFIYGLLMAPEPNEPLDSVLALEYHTDQEGFFLKAQRQTAEHAGSSAAYLELKKEYMYNTMQTSEDTSVMVQVRILEEKDEHIHDLQRKNDDLQRQNDDLQRQNDDLQRENDDLQQELQQKKDDLELAYDDLKRTKEELGEKTAFSWSLSEANDDLNRQLERARQPERAQATPSHSPWTRALSFLWRRRNEGGASP